MLWFLIAGLLLVAVAFLVMPLFRTQDESGDNRREQNIQIVREQMAELESSVERAEVESDDYHARRAELEQALYLDVDGDAEQIRNKASTTSRVSAGFVMLFVPISALAFYLYLGSPQAPQMIEEARNNPPAEIPLKADGTPDVEKLVASLHDKLRKSPANAEGWYMLGRSYMMMQQFDGAVEAYDNLNKLQPNEPDVMLMLADALSMQQGGQMAGRPEALINEALVAAPENTTALWLSGMALEQQEKYQEAFDRWTVLRPLLEDIPQEQEQLDILINRVKAKLTGDTPVVTAAEVAESSVPAPAAKADSATTDEVAKAATEAATTQGAQVTLNVGLSDALREQAAPEDSVFIYAKAQTGPPMPLAAKRLQVKDLPATVILDDSMAMMPQFTLSAFDTLIVGARVSKSGNAVVQDGDLYTEQEQVAHGDTVTLSIDSVLKK